MTATTASTKLLIDGRWVDGLEPTGLRVVDPADGSDLGPPPSASERQVQEALVAADSGFRVWSRTSPDERARVLADAADRLAETVEQTAPLLTHEQGKPLAESRAELTSVVAMLRWFAGRTGWTGGRVQPGSTPDLSVEVAPRPLGPVAVLTPWNFPVSLASRKLAAALAVGASAIVKPAPEAPSAFLSVAAALLAAGLPDGVLGVLNGDPERISTALISSDTVRGVSFTGSTPVGRSIGALAGRHVKPVTLELGGHAPVVVTDDVDLEGTVAQLARAAFMNAGQVCVSPTRILVQDGVADDFTQAFVERTRALRVGPGTEPDTEMGPVALRRHRDRLLDLVERSTAAGARLTTGGRAAPGAGWFLEPTVLCDVPVEAALMREEPFGPVALINRFAADEEAVAECNRLPWGLAAYAFCGDAERGQRIVDAVEAGTVGLNTCAILHVDSSLGGVKDSGHGRDGGPEGMAEFRCARTVTSAPA